MIDVNPDIYEAYLTAYAKVRSGTPIVDPPSRDVGTWIIAAKAIAVDDARRGNEPKAWLLLHAAIDRMINDATA